MLIDEDQSGEIDFNEFVAVMCTYCMYTQADILKFAFETFDKDGSGSIDEEEFMDLCKTINAMNPTFPGNFGRACQFDLTTLLSKSMALRAWVTAQLTRMAEQRTERKTP